MPECCNCSDQGLIWILKYGFLFFAYVIKNHYFNIVIGILIHCNSNETGH